MRALKIRSTVAGHGKVTKNNREPELILSQLQEKLPQNSTSVILRLFGTCSKLEGEKAAMTSSVFGPRRSSKALAKAKLVPKKKEKKRFRSLFGGLLPVWFTAAFCIPVKPLHMRSVLSKLMRCTKNCNACSQHWSTERPNSSHQQRPAAPCKTNTSKLQLIGLQGFASSVVFT